MRSIHSNGSDETFELILRRIISVNQLQCLRSSSTLVWIIVQRLKRFGETRRDWESGINLFYRQDFLNANPTPLTDAEVQRNLLREYEQKFADPPDDQKLTKLCSDVGFLMDIGRKDNSSLHLKKKGRRRT